MGPKVEDIVAIDETKIGVGGRGRGRGGRERGRSEEGRKEGGREGKVRNLVRNVFWLGALEWQVA